MYILSDRQKGTPSLHHRENDDVIVVLSLENHPLVVPKEHVPDIHAMGDRTGAAVMAEAIRIARAVKKGVRCDAITLIHSNGPAAGQDVFHFHMHVYPCWEGREVQAISRFVRSAPDRDHVTGEMKTEKVDGWEIRTGVMGRSYVPEVAK
jgi:histidine triad (HIT) family protein